MAEMRISVDVVGLEVMTELIEVMAHFAQDPRVPDAVQEDYKIRIRQTLEGGGYVFEDF